MAPLLNTWYFVYLILPLLILLGRVCDVTLGTIRIMFVTRGNKLFAPILGFFEVFIWLLAIRQIMQNLNNILCYFAYAGGFAIGNLIGIKIEEKLAYGKLIVRIITSKDAGNLTQSLRRKGFGVTRIPAEGSRGRVSVVYTIIDRAHLDRVIRAIDQYNPKSFYTIEDVRSAKEGIFPGQFGSVRRFFARPPKFYRQLRVYRRMLIQRKSK